MTNHMRQLIALFAARASDRSTFDELSQMLSQRSTWRGAHDLFPRIRQKSLQAVERGDTAAEQQYRFEEVCAKSLYNLTRESAPFDPDSPYWVVPRAFVLARSLGIPEAEVLRIIVA